MTKLENVRSENLYIHLNTTIINPKPTLNYSEIKEEI